MKTKIRELYYWLYIRVIALRWIRTVNLGNCVLYRGEKCQVNNGVVAGHWTLIKPSGETVHAPTSECKKVWSFRGAVDDYRSGVRFYMGYWYRIWVMNGIQPWVRALPIWGKSR